VSTPTGIPSPIRALRFEPLTMQHLKKHKLLLGPTDRDELSSPFVEISGFTGPEAEEFATVVDVDQVSAVHQIVIANDKNVAVENAIPPLPWYRALLTLKPNT